MVEPSFFPAPQPLTVAAVAELTGARLANAVDPARTISGVGTLNSAGPAEASFVEGRAYLAELAATRAGACFCHPRFVPQVPDHVAALETREPARALAILATRLFPSAMAGVPVWQGTGVSPAALVDPTAGLEDGVTVEPQAIVAPGAMIGSGTRIGAGAVIGPSVRIGRNVVVGVGATIVHALIGNDVLIHPGVRIGQDGFGFVPGRDGHLKVPQIGRVIIQDKVELGANTTVDRGSLRDTIIGEGTKIDNLCQVAHNVVIGRHCLIAGHVGISGSVTIGDFVNIGGHCGIAGHLTIGSGVSLAGKSGVMHDIPAGEKWIGAPAMPVKEWIRRHSGPRTGRSGIENKDGGESE